MFHYMPWHDLHESLISTLIFHCSRIISNVVNKVIIDNHELTQVNSAKYIGVIIDTKLIWIKLSHM